MPKSRVHETIYSRADLLTGLSDEIWGYAETAFVEDRSVEALCRVLRQAGFEVQTGVCGVRTAFCARFGSGEPVIGLLGEYDALFGLSQRAGLTVKEPLEPGAPGHGCGHNLLGAGALGAAIAVAEYLGRSGGPGTVIFYGCPGEEGGSGKAFMAREGIFDGLDAAVTWHPGSLNMVSSGSSLANIQVAYRFKGVSAHAAADPYNGRSALDAVELLNIGVQFMREHIIPEARVHYAITNTGGLSPNVVQPEAEVLYLCRAPSNGQAGQVFNWVTDIARGAALMTQTELEIKFVKACSNLIQNNTLERVLYENMQAVPLPGYTQEEWALAERYNRTAPGKKDNIAKYGSEGGPAVVDCFKKNAGKALGDFLVPYFASNAVMMGSTDVGDVSWITPTAQINTVTQATETPGHSWQTVAQGCSSVAHKGMLYAAEVMAGAVIDLFENPELRQAARRELEERVGPCGYVCPIPQGVEPRPISGKL